MKSVLLSVVTARHASAAYFGLVSWLIVFGSTVQAQPMSHARHPSGFNVSFPTDWRAAVDGQALVLIAPGWPLSTPADGIRVLAQPSDVVVTAQAFLEAIDQLVAQASGFKRVVAVEAFAAKGGTGARLVYGTSPRASENSRLLSVHAVRVGRLAVMVFAVGPPQLIVGHEPALRAIAAALAPGDAQSPAAPPREPAPASPPAVTAPVPGPASPDSGLRPSPPVASPLVAAWKQRLAGKALVLVSSYNSGAGGGGMSSKVEIYLATDGRFEARAESAVVINVPGAGGSSGGVEQATGRWRLFEAGGEVMMEMTYSTGLVETNRLQARGSETYINDRRWFVTDPR